MGARRISIDPELLEWLDVEEPLSIVAIAAKLGCADNAGEESHHRAARDTGRSLRGLLPGCLDSDGSVLVYTDAYHAARRPQYVYERLYVSLVSASRRFLDWIKASIGPWSKLRERSIVAAPPTDRSFPASPASAPRP